jgi:Response regulator containing CheY-like receiver, AAA-type ATPase, and DNA-binding domains
MQIDVFIIDIELPDWNGIELVIVIRKTYPYQPIIIESSQGEAQYQEQVYNRIADLAFIKKPYIHEKIIEKVNHALIKQKL